MRLPAQLGEQPERCRQRVASLHSQNISGWAGYRITRRNSAAGLSRSHAIANSLLVDRFFGARLGEKEQVLDLPDDVFCGGRS
jgi:hypothetical protein